MVRSSCRTAPTSSRDSTSVGRVTSALLFVLAALVGCRPQAAKPTQSIDAAKGPAGAPAAASSPDDGQWVRPGKDFQGTRFSGLTEINAQNAASLRVVSTFATGNIRGHEAAPIVANGTM